MGAKLPCDRRSDAAVRAEVRPHGLCRALGSTFAGFNSVGVQSANGPAAAEYTFEELADASGETYVWTRAGMNALEPSFFFPSVTCMRAAGGRGAAECQAGHT